MSGAVAQWLYDPKIELIKNQYTIMNVGNSYTYGLGAPPGQSYSDQLSDLLKNRPIKKYNVINRGLTNANTSLINERIDGWLKNDKPDMVFLMVGEPNQWNRYGYWKFLDAVKGDKHEKIVSDNFEILRWSSTYRLFEMLMKKNENREGLSNVGYSSVFKSTPLDEEHRWLLGYQWLGGLQNGSLIELVKMTTTEIDEAITALEFIEVKDNNHIAAIYLAEILMVHKKDYNRGMDYIDRSIKNADYFDYNQWGLIGSYRDLFLDYAPERYHGWILQLKQKIDPKFLDVLTEKMKGHKYHSYELMGESFLYQASKYVPVHTDIPRLYVQRNILIHPEKSFEMIERTLLINPFSYNSNLLESAYQLAKNHPQLKDRYEALVNKIEMKAGGINIREMVQAANLDREWIVHDLEEIIKKVKATGAKVVVQTYPPYRRGTPRFADLILRKWWESYQDKKDVTFMDVGAELNKLFAQENGGEKFYSTILGSTDDHPNAEGYGYIARMMEPIIP